MATLGGAGSLTSVVLQMYNHPKFYSDFYAFTVSDTTSVGSTVLLLSAASDVPNAKLIYRLRSKFCIFFYYPVGIDMILQG